MKNYHAYEETIWWWQSAWKYLMKSCESLTIQAVLLGYADEHFDKSFAAETEWMVGLAWQITLFSEQSSVEVNQVCTLN